MVSDREYEGVKVLAKTERNFRFVVNVIAIFLFITICLLAWVVVSTESTARRSRETVVNKLEAALRETERQNDATRKYTTCLLVVPIEQRTPERQRKCLDDSGLKNIPVYGYTPNDAEVVTLPNETSNQQADASDFSSSQQSTPKTQTSQPNNVQSTPTTPGSATNPDPNPSNVQKVENLVRRIVLDINPLN